MTIQNASHEASKQFYQENKNKYDLVVYIGRFQPFHKGHLAAVAKAYSYSENVMLIIGSANSPRTIKNPFTAKDRENIIRQIPGCADLIIQCVEDYHYNDYAWIEQIQKLVKEQTEFLSKFRGIDKPKVAIIGYNKDDSSYYLKFFPEWDFIENASYLTMPIDATKIREFWFTDQMIYLHNVLHHTTFDFLKNFKSLPEFNTLCEEYSDVDEYKRKWRAAPYTPSFYTADAVVVQGGNVLMVTRGKSPGKGLLALPGGFVEPTETAKEAALRELIEETSIALSFNTLQGSITKNHTFDKPDRSLRGRTVTQAFLFELKGGVGKLPKVKAADDAQGVQWVPLAELASKKHMIFEDHYAIIMTMLGKLK